MDCPGAFSSRKSSAKHFGYRLAPTTKRRAKLCFLPPAVPAGDPCVSPSPPAFSPNVPWKHFCAAVNPTRDMFLCTAQVGRYRCSCNPPRLLPALAAGGGPAEEEALNLPRESQSTANNPHDAQQECQPTSAHRKRKRIRGGCLQNETPEGARTGVVWLFRWAPH